MRTQHSFLCLASYKYKPKWFHPMMKPFSDILAPNSFPSNYIFPIRKQARKNFSSLSKKGRSSIFPITPFQMPLVLWHPLSQLDYLPSLTLKIQLIPCHAFVYILPLSYQFITCHSFAILSFKIQLRFKLFYKVNYISRILIFLTINNTV